LSDVSLNIVFESAYSVLLTWFGISGGWCRQMCRWCRFVGMWSWDLRVGFTSTCLSEPTQVPWTYTRCVQRTVGRVHCLVMHAQISAYWNMDIIKRNPPPSCCLSHTLVTSYH